MQPGMEVSILGGGETAGTQLAFPQHTSRSLLNKSHNHSKAPKCPKCWIFTKYQGRYYGHCKSGKKLYNCTKNKAFAFSMAPGPKGTQVPTSSKGRARAAELRATAPFVSCFQDSDCALPAADFPPLRGSAAVSVGGKLSATCRRPSFVTDPNFIDFPGICICTYATPAAPPAVTELLSTCDSAAAILLSLDGLTLDGNPVSSFFKTDFCVQRQGRGPGGVVDDRPFFVPGPEPIDENEDPNLPGPPRGTVSDPSKYAIGVVIEDAYVLINDTTAAMVNPDGDDGPGGDTPSGCTDGAKCAENNLPCAGSAVELPVALPCCSSDYLCVRRNSRFSQCRRGGIPPSSLWEGSILPCGSAFDADVS